MSQTNTSFSDRAQAWKDRHGLVLFLCQLGVRANHITFVGLIAGLFAGYALARGWYGWSVAGFAMTGICDYLDGAVARASGTICALGKYTDTIVDRLEETAVFIGAQSSALVFASTLGAGTLVRWLVTFAPMTALATSLLVTFVKIHGEGLGVRGFPRVIGRPVRWSITLLGLLLGWWFGPAWWFGTLWILIGVNVGVVIVRHRHAVRHLSSMP